MKYLQDRGLAKTEGRKVWCFCGDGEMDEPESMGAIGMAARENLDNLIFVVNCNLQRLDGPVRGNGKIIQELEADFRGAGWNVIKVDLGHALGPAARARQERHPDAPDDGMRRRRVPDVQVEGRRVRARALLQHARAEGAGRRLVRRGHLEPESRRPRSAQGLCRISTPRSTTRASRPSSSPRRSRATAWASRARRRTSRTSRRRCRSSRSGASATASSIPVPDDKLEEVPYVTFRRRLAGGRVHASAADGAGRLPADAPAQGRSAGRCRRWRRSSASSRAPRIARSRRRWRSCRSCSSLLRDKNIGKHIVPIVPDESRTFGMEGMFRQLGIWNQQGPALHAAGRRPAHVLQGKQGRPDPAGGHQRGRRRCATGSPRRRRIRRTACR